MSKTILALIIGLIVLNIGIVRADIPVYVDSFTFSDVMPFSEWNGGESGASYFLANGNKGDCFVEDARVLCEVSSLYRTQVFVDGEPFLIQEGEFTGNVYVCLGGAIRFELGDYYSVTVEGDRDATTVSVFKSRPVEENFVFQAPRCSGTLTILFTKTSMEVKFNGQALGKVEREFVGGDNEFHIAAVSGTGEFDNLRIGVEEPVVVTVPVQVNIDRVFTAVAGCDDGLIGGEADFYPVVRIDGVEHTDTPEADDNEIFPRWIFGAPVKKGTVPIEIEIWNDNPDPILDVQCDINPDPNKLGLRILYDVVKDEFVGDSADIATGKLITNSTGDGGNAAEICFSINHGSYLVFCKIDAVQISYGQDANGDGVTDLVQDMDAVALSQYLSRGLISKTMAMDLKLLVDGAEVDTRQTTLLDLQNRNDIAELFFTARQDNQRVRMEASWDSYISRIAIPVEVKQTRDLKISYMRIDQCNSQKVCYEAVGQYAEVMQNTRSSVRKHFPNVEQEVKDLGFSFAGNPDISIAGINDNGNVVTRGVIEDLRICGFLGKLRDPFGEFFHCAVGDDYSTYHQADWLGIAGFCDSAKSALVSSSINTGSHETAHSACQDHTRGIVRGYDAAERKFKTHLEKDLTCDGCGIAQGAWPTAETVNTLISYFLVDPTDPKLHVISGYVYENGAVEVKQSAQVPSGTATLPNLEGKYSIVTLDKNGVVIGEIPFNASFKIVTEEAGDVGIGKSPFVLAVPSQDVATIEIQKEGEAKVKINPHATSIRNIVEAIPLHAFICGNQTPERRKEGMLRVEKAYEKFLAKGEFEQAERKVNQIRTRVIKHIEKDLVLDVLGYTKPEVLEIIEKEIERVHSLIPEKKYLKNKDENKGDDEDNQGDGHGDGEDHGEEDDDEVEKDG